MAQFLAPGVDAPGFRLKATPDQYLSLDELRGTPAVLVFYPADWSPVCGDELAIFNEVLPEIEKYGAKVVGISVDGAWCHAAYSRQQHLHFPLLADFEPKGDVARNYGAYNTKEGVAERALFVLDPQGQITWSYCSPMAVNPGVDGVLQALEDMKTQGESHGHVETANHTR